MTTETDPDKHAGSSTEHVGAEAFRDSVSTADKEGHRVWVYPKKPEGRLYNWRSFFSIFQIGLLLGTPFLRIDGQPVLMLNIIERKFVILGKVFWPQDFHLFVLGMLCFVVFIILFTAVYGRLFCGWLCPQTVFLEMMFRKIEYWIDGDSSQQKRLAAAPWTGDKITKRLLKHGVFLALALVIGNVLLAYIIGSDAVLALIHDTPAKHLGGFTAMLIFTGIFYWVYSYFREQVCCFICPYGRLQSVLLDNNSINVMYDHKRGEPRERFKKGDATEVRQDRGAGDCINCGMCTKVCPTGIDIRNGIQLECVNCTACIDACNFMMDKVGMPKGLIRYASQDAIDNGTRFTITPRLIIYTFVLTVLLGVMTTLLVTRQDVEVKVIRSRGELFQLSGENQISNVFNISVINKTNHELPVNLALTSHSGTLEISGGTLTAAPASVTPASLVVRIPLNELHPYSNEVTLVVKAGDELETDKVIPFMAPSKVTTQ